MKYLLISVLPVFAFLIKRLKFQRISKNILELILSSYIWLLSKPNELNDSLDKLTRNKKETIISKCPFGKISVVTDGKLAQQICLKNTDKWGLPYYVLDKFISGNNKSSSGNLIATTSNKDAFLLKNRTILFNNLNSIFIENIDKVKTISDKFAESLSGIVDFKSSIHKLIFNIFSTIFLNSNPEILFHLFTELLEEFGNKPTKFLFMIKATKIQKKIDNQVEHIMKMDLPLFNNVEFSSKEEKLNLIKLLIFAGFETTANTLCWVFHHLSLHPQCQDKCTLDDTYIEACIKEAMRLDPIVNITARKDNNKNYLFYIKGIHTDKNCWKNADKFDPNRFINKNYGDSPDATWMPFQIGHRQCLGKEVAMTEMKIITKAIVNVSTFSSLEKIKKITKFTLEPEKLKLKFIQKKIPIPIKMSTKETDKVIVIFNGNKYNVTEYLDEHPGGSAIIKMNNNADITEAFNSIGHSENALEILEKMRI